MIVAAAGALGERNEGLGTGLKLKVVLIGKI